MIAHILRQPSDALLKPAGVPNHCEGAQRVYEGESHARVTLVIVQPLHIP